MTTNLNLPTPEELEEMRNRIFKRLNESIVKNKAKRPGKSKKSMQQIMDNRKVGEK